MKVLWAPTRREHRLLEAWLQGWRNVYIVYFMIWMVMCYLLCGVAVEYYLLRCKGFSLPANFSCWVSFASVHAGFCGNYVCCIGYVHAAVSPYRLV